jgi:transposase
MDALAASHDACVEIIDTSIVRVHQNGACISRNKRQSMGRLRGGLISKIHALVDRNSLPVRLALIAGEAHDNRLPAKLLSHLKSGAMLLAARIRCRLDQGSCRQYGRLGEHPTATGPKDALCFRPHLYRARNLIERFVNRIKQCR